MKSSCLAPNLQSALLEAAREGSMPEPELLAHLDDCDNCRGAIERLRRMVSVWVAEQDEADNGAIVAAAERFGRRAGRAKPPSWQSALPFAFAGAVAAAALLVATPRTRSSGTPTAAGASPTRVDSTSAARPAQETARGALDPAKPNVAHIRGPRGVAPLANGLRIELGKGETATVELEGGRSSELHGPCAVEFWSSASDVGGWRLSPVEPATSGILLDDPMSGAAPTEVAPNDPAPATDARPAEGTTTDVASNAKSDAASANRASRERGANPASRETAQPAERGVDLRVGSMGDIASASSGDPKVERAWARAVEALRRDDFGTADSAFADLCRSTEATTRDAARLARAQLWMAYGRGAAVRPVLVELASQGATALVRQRAAEFLARPTR